METVQIERLDPAAVFEANNALSALLIDSVKGGASVGYTSAPQLSEAITYWGNVARQVESGTLVLFLARLSNEAVGTVQLKLDHRPNASHRGEVAKLLVHSNQRRKGIATKLMSALHQESRRRGLSLLVLDTRTNDPSQALYEQLGYQVAGIIPDYARASDGSLSPTTYLYLQL